MLRIFHTHMARTSLLQDFSYYELQAAQKQQQQQVASQSPPPGAGARMQSPPPSQQLSPTLQPQQHPFAMANPAALAYAGQVQQLSPMMGMGMNLPGMNPQQAQYAAAMQAQGVFRHASPGPPAQGQFMGMPQGF
jgi:YTH domain-containing family protein